MGETVFVIQAKRKTGAAYTVNDAYAQGRRAVFEPRFIAVIAGCWFNDDFSDWDSFWNGVLDKMQSYEYAPAESRWGIYFLAIIET